MLADPNSYFKLKLELMSERIQDKFTPLNEQPGTHYYQSDQNQKLEQADNIRNSVSLTSRSPKKQ
jgi:hypothetical protein